jgi:hypothetical protein
MITRNFLSRRSLVKAALVATASCALSAVGLLRLQPAGAEEDPNAGPVEFIPIISAENPVDFSSMVSQWSSPLPQDIAIIENILPGKQLILRGVIDASRMQGAPGGIAIVDGEDGRTQLHLDYAASGAWDAYYVHLLSSRQEQLVKGVFSQARTEPESAFTITCRTDGQVIIALGNGETAVFSKLPERLLKAGKVGVVGFIGGSSSILTLKSLEYALEQPPAQDLEPAPQLATPEKEIEWETKIIVSQKPVSIEGVAPGKGTNSRLFAPGYADTEVKANQAVKILAQISLTPTTPSELYPVGGLRIANISSDENNPEALANINWTMIYLSRDQGSWKINIYDKGESIPRPIAVIADDSHPSTTATFEMTLDANGQTGSIRSLGEQQAKIEKFDLGQQFYRPERRAVQLSPFSQKNTKTTISKLLLSKSL